MPGYLQSPILVIGFGSQLRSDDAVGPRVAEAIEQMELADVAAISRHQLTPELAQAISSASLVIFVDAKDSSQTALTVSPVQASASGEFPAHKCNPSALLALSECVFGHCPPAWCVAIPCQNFEIGEDLSPIALEGIALATREVERLCRAYRPNLANTLEKRGVACKNWT